MKYAWIDRNRLGWPVSMMCEQLEVSISGYHQYVRRKDRPQGASLGPRRMSNDALLAHIKVIHTKSKQEYGWPRVWKELLLGGIPVGKERVRTLMKLHGIRAKTKRKFKATTDSAHDLPVAPNLIARDFSPAAPDRVWTTDITYLATDEGWLYLTVMLDLFSRRVVGWAIGPRMTKKLVTDALRMAWFRRHPAAGLIVHSDRGAQGGFNRSSQHLQPGGVYGKTSGMDEAVNREGRAALSWGSFASARDRKGVLGTDCNRNHQREGSGGRWCIPGCGLTLVPASWRYAIVHVKTHFRKMSVICGARRDRASSSPRRRRPGNCPPNWPKPFDCLTGVNTQCCDSWWQARVPSVSRTVEVRADGQETQVG